MDSGDSTLGDVGGRRLKVPGTGSEGEEDVVNGERGADEEGNVDGEEDVDRDNEGEITLSYHNSAGWDQ